MGLRLKSIKCPGCKKDFQPKKSQQMFCSRHCVGIKDITGQRFGKLIAIKKAENAPVSNCTRWLCVCDCGATAEPFLGNLLRGFTKSCGCGHQSWDVFPREAYEQSSSARQAKYLGDNYLKTLIANRYKIDRKIITPEMVKLKRFQLGLRRERIKAKKEITA